MKLRYPLIGVLACLGLAGCSQQTAPTPTTATPTEVATEASAATTEAETEKATEPEMTQAPATGDPVKEWDDTTVSVDYRFDGSDSDPVLKLFKEYAKANEGKNFVFSPYSIRDALSLLVTSADEEAMKELQEVLGIPENRICFEVLDVLSKEKDGFDVANKAYLSDALVEGEINTELLRADDFQTIDMDGDGADVINKWVAEITKDKIQNLVTKESISESALVLVNALYFNQQFRKTYEDDSILWSDGKYYASFMGEAGSVDVLEPNEDIDVLRLRYKDTDYSLYIICDNVDSETIGVEDFIKSLSTEEFDALFKEGEKEYDEVTFSVPNFEIEGKGSVTDMLRNLGMKATFDSQTSHFSELGNVYVSDVMHGAYIKTDKTGTEAAGATSVGMEFASAPPLETLKKIVRADSPFMFVVRDTKMNTTLFAGMVQEPTTLVD